VDRDRAAVKVAYPATTQLRTKDVVAINGNPIRWGSIRQSLIQQYGRKARIPSLKPTEDKRRTLGKSSALRLVGGVVRPQTLPFNVCLLFSEASL
jgi:hypothetical protein